MMGSVQRGLATFLVTLTCMMLCASTVAHAEDDADHADALSQEGSVLAKNGDFEAARGRFEQALALDPKPRRQCNVGSAYFKLKQWPQAHFYLRVCLSYTPTFPPAFVAQMNKAYAFVDKTLRAGEFALVHFETAPVAGVVELPTLTTTAQFRAPRSVWLPVGRHRATATAPGHTPAEKLFSAVAGEQRVEILLAAEPSIEEPKPPDTPATTAVTTPTVTTPPAITAPLLPPPPSSQTTAYVGFSVGAASLLVGIYFHARSAAIRSDLESSPTDRTQLVKDLKQARIWMGGFYGLSAVAVGFATWSWLDNRAAEPGLAVSAGVAADRADIWLQWPM